MPQIERSWKNIYNRTSNAHTLITVIHGILKQHAANQNKKVGKNMILEEKVGKIGSLDPQHCLTTRPGRDQVIQHSRVGK